MTHECVIDIAYVHSMTCSEYSTSFGKDIPVRTYVDKDCSHQTSQTDVLKLQAKIPNKLRCLVNMKGRKI